jgi:hypothetical protein
VIVTEQNPTLTSSSGTTVPPAASLIAVALGKPDDRIDLGPLGPLHLGTFEKTLFNSDARGPFSSTSMMCTSSLTRVWLQQGRDPAGAQITTSESMLFQLQGAYFTPHLQHR